MRISDWSSDVCSSDLALGQAVVPSARLSYGSGSPETLADAVDRVDPPGGTLAAVDPDMPDPAVVAAARTRKPDPVEAITADVATRPAPKTATARGAATAEGAAPPPSPAVPPAPPAPERGSVGKECVSTRTCGGGRVTR